MDEAVHETPEGEIRMFWNDPPLTPFDQMSVGLKAFTKFEAANPHVYDFFKFFTKVAIRKGHKHLSPWLIMNRVRWETEIETVSEDGFKISNNHFAYYSRMFMYENPKHNGFFATKEMANEDEITHWMKQNFEERDDTDDRA